MSVYQVEEFYIHVDISKMNAVGRLKLVEYLTENNYNDFEIDSDGYITADNFESVMDAEIIERGIIELLENNST